jgi:hypothetical protein
MTAAEAALMAATSKKLVDRMDIMTANFATVQESIFKMKRGS